MMTPVTAALLTGTLSLLKPVSALDKSCTMTLLPHLNDYITSGGVLKEVVLHQVTSPVLRCARICNIDPNCSSLSIHGESRRCRLHSGAFPGNSSLTASQGFTSYNVVCVSVDNGCVDDSQCVNTNSVCVNNVCKDVQSVCPLGWLYSASPAKMCYYHLGESVDYAAGKQRCQDMLGTLATPQTAEDGATIDEVMSQAPWWSWIGLEDSQNEGEWLWLDGKAVTDTWSNWGPSEPNNAGNEDCAATAPGQQWEDRNCGKVLMAVCQVHQNVVWEAPTQVCDPQYHNCG